MHQWEDTGRGGTSLMGHPSPVVHVVPAVPKRPGGGAPGLESKRNPHFQRKCFRMRNGDNELSVLSLEEQNPTGHLCVGGGEGYASGTVKLAF